MTMCEVPSSNVVPGGGLYTCLKIQGPYDFLFVMIFLSLLTLLLYAALRFSLKCELLV